MSRISDAFVETLLEEITDYELVTLTQEQQVNLSSVCDEWEDRESIETEINLYLKAIGYEYDDNDCKWKPIPPPIVEMEVSYWDRADRLTSTSTIQRTEKWKGTKEEIFKRFDKENNSLRYCNGSYYKFDKQSHQNEYIAWYGALDEGTKFNMFYGNGIVD